MLDLNGVRKLSSYFLLLVTILALFVTISGAFIKVELTARIFQLLFFPVTLYLLLTSFNHFFGHEPAIDRREGLRRIVVYYCFVISSTLVIVSFLSSRTLPQYISAAIFSPLAIYFLFLVLPHGTYAIEIANVAKGSAGGRNLKDLLPTQRLDVDRRDFLKLIGTAGVLAFVFSLFSKKGVPFFGATTAIGTASLLDSTGQKINPAEKSPTDNFFITEIDDSAPTAYFGFINNHGQWYIMKEGANSDFRYSRGDSDFNGHWLRRDSLNYGYFNDVF